MSEPRKNPGECDCCGFVTKNLGLFAKQDTTIAGSGATVKADFWYCDLCSSTVASVYHRYPNQTPSNQQVLAAICYVGNELLRAIRKQGQS